MGGKVQVEEASRDAKDSLVSSPFADCIRGYPCGSSRAERRAMEFVTARLEDFDARL